MGITARLGDRRACDRSRMCDSINLVRCWPCVKSLRSEINVQLNLRAARDRTSRPRDLGDDSSGWRGVGGATTERDNSPSKPVGGECLLSGCLRHPNNVGYLHR
jgi:hypothetical protein